LTMDEYESELPQQPSGSWPLTGNVPSLGRIWANLLELAS
jgi:hypothetical protein